MNPSRHEPRSTLADVVVAAAAALGGAARLLAAPAAPGSFDEVGFTVALERYDLLAFEPHFPGYPLAVLLARGAAGLGAAAPYAAVAAGLALVAALALHVALGRGWGGALAGGLLALAPTAVLTSSRATSDGVALGLLGLAFAALARASRGGWGRSGLAGALLACVAAAKPDLVLLLPALALSARPWAAAAGALCVLCAAAMALIPGAGGVAPLLAEAARFTAGHLGDWGGGVLASATVGGPRPLLVLASLCQALGANDLLGALVAGAALASLTLLAPRRARRAAVVACLPYAAWLLLGQNLADPRHVLPLLVPAAALAGLGLRRAAARPALRAGLALALLVATGAGAARGVLEVRARGRQVDALQAILEVEGALRLYTGGEARALTWRRPGADVRRARSVAHALDDLAADPCPPARVWVASTVPGARALPLARDLEGVRLHVLVQPPDARRRP